MTVKLLTEDHLEFLSLKGGYAGSSESFSRTDRSFQIPNSDTTPKWHSINDDASLFRRCMFVVVLPRIGLYCFSNDVDDFFCCFPRSIIIVIAAMLHLFVRYVLYLLFLLCLYPGVNKELM